MNFFIFLIAAYIMGCLAGIPAGPVQIEVVRKSLNGHLRPSLMVVLGAFFADVFYGSIAFFGIAPYLEEERVMAVFWLAGGIIMTALGILVIHRSLKKREVGYTADRPGRKRWAFLEGLSLSAANPMMILWWLSGVRLFQDIGLIGDFTADVAAAFLAAGSLGLASYLVALSLFIYWAKRFVSAKTLRHINVVFGSIILMIALYFLATSFSSLIHIY